MSLLRQAVGPERLPDAGSGGYRLTGIETDWQRFRQLTSEADGADPVEACRLRFDALGLVRGEPFAGVEGYRWALDEHLATEMTVSVVTLARRLTEDLANLGDLPGAERAARMGLRASRHEQTLSEDLARVVVAGGDATAISRLWRDLSETLGSEAVGRMKATVGVA